MNNKWHEIIIVEECHTWSERYIVSYMKSKSESYLYPSKNIMHCNIVHYCIFKLVGTSLYIKRLKYIRRAYSVAWPGQVYCSKTCFLGHPFLFLPKKCNDCDILWQQRRSIYIHIKYFILSKLLFSLFLLWMHRYYKFYFLHRFSIFIVEYFVFGHIQ